jgi:hypothetical protein
MASWSRPATGALVWEYRRDGEAVKFNGRNWEWRGEILDADGNEVGW